MMSLASPAVYSIPMLLLIGWRGQTGIKDEPQHMAQGHITPQLIGRKGSLLSPLTCIIQAINL